MKISIAKEKKRRIKKIISIFFWFLPDYMYIKLMYFIRMRRICDLKNPKTFNEKLQYLKLYDRNPLYTTMVDKYEVKEYVSKIIGNEYIIPTIGIYDSFDDINFDKLPEKFVLKTTHDSGGVIVCKDKRLFNKNKAKKFINNHLKNNYYKSTREWPYKNVKRRILVEKYMEDRSINDLYDYKFFCFNGHCKCYKVDFDRFIEHHANYYDTLNNLLKDGEADYPPIKNKQLLISKNIELMKKLSEKLSSNIPFLRCDFYDINGKVYFGELTFFPASGFGEFTSNEFDFQLGEWINLPDEMGGGYIIVVNDLLIYLKNSNYLVDYKFHCFDGEPKFLYISNSNIKNGIKNDLLTHLNIDYTIAPFQREDHEQFLIGLIKPYCYKKMVSIAKELSKDIPFIRVDLFCINDKPYFSELTFFPGSGYFDYSPSEYNKKIGNYINLNKL